eukprot:4144236-Amphidinium_carterae.1
MITTTVAPTGFNCAQASIVFRIGNYEKLTAYVYKAFVYSQSLLPHHGPQPPRESIKTLCKSRRQRIKPRTNAVFRRSHRVRDLFKPLRGSAPGSRLQVMWALSTMLCFIILVNGFTGALPESGIRTMST